MYNFPLLIITYFLDVPKNVNSLNQNLFHLTFPHHSCEMLFICLFITVLGVFYHNKILEIYCNKFIRMNSLNFREKSTFFLN